MVTISRTEISIDFGLNADEVYVIFDNRCQLDENDELFIKCQYSKYGSTSFRSNSDFPFNQALKLDDKHLKIKLLRSSEPSKEPCWGYKLTFVGFSFDNPFYWIPNVHLNFYNHFIVFLANVYQEAYRSTQTTKI